jgi:hypothetical protein
MAQPSRSTPAGRRGEGAKRPHRVPTRTMRAQVWRRQSAEVIDDSSTSRPPQLRPRACRRPASRRRRDGDGERRARGVAHGSPRPAASRSRCASNIIGVHDAVLGQLPAAHLSRLGRYATKRKARPASPTAGSARCRAGGFRSTGPRKWRRSIASATRVSRSSTFTSIW